jgi:hypothetical protein
MNDEQLERLVAEGRRQRLAAKGERTWWRAKNRTRSNPNPARGADSSEGGLPGTFRARARARLAGAGPCRPEDIRGVFSAAEPVAPESGEPAAFGLAPELVRAR